MPCLNEAAHVEACLRGVLRQDYPRDLFEVLVADGGSSDGTRDLLAGLAREDPRLRIIDNPARLQAPGLNAILRQARGAVVVRMDVHCEYAPDYIRRCVEVLERTGADNVGGAQRPVATTSFQQALCAALESPLGAGGARYRAADQEGFVDTVFLGAFRRRVFETVGLYDPGAITNEDAELNQRILAAGGRIYLSRDIVVHYSPRNSFRSLARQYFRYGRGRARTALSHLSLLNARPVVPFAFVFVASVLLAIPPARPLGYLLVGAYALAVTTEAARLAAHHGVSLFPRIAIDFAVMHVSHGLGFAAGCVRYLARPDWKEPERLAS